MNSLDLSTSATSRRRFLRYASLAAAAPVFTEAHFAMAAQQAAGSGRRTREAPPTDAVLINANENPLGPCKAACERIASIAPWAAATTTTTKPAS